MSPEVMDRSAPALLVSYVYLDKFRKMEHKYHYRDWIMDSGAFSAWASGKEIDIHQYIEVCKRLTVEDKRMTEIIALDVIGSDKGSLRNSLIMRDAGVVAMPVFHLGDDWGILKEYLDGWDKVGLSCSFWDNKKESYKFYDQCFAKGWPKKFHSFGWVEEEMLLRYPFHSADSSSWEIGPCAFGRWRTFGKMSMRGSSQDLRAEVKWYLDLEARLALKWGPQFRKLGWTPDPTVRLAAGSSPRPIEKPEGGR